MRLPVVLLVVCSVFARGDVSAQTIRDLVGTNVSVRVIAVSDGDTVDAIPVGEQRAIRLRLEGIDAPERGEPFSQEARNAARLLLFGQTVRVEGRDVDRYGRLVARIRVAGKDVSSELVRAGLACRYREYASDPVLAKAEADARAAGRGFWARGAAKPRCVTTQAQTRRGGGNAANFTSVGDGVPRQHHQSGVSRSVLPHLQLPRLHAHFWYGSRGASSGIPARRGLPSPAVDLALVEEDDLHPAGARRALHVDEAVLLFPDDDDLVASRERRDIL